MIWVGQSITVDRPCEFSFTHPAFYTSVHKWKEMKREPLLKYTLYKCVTAWAHPPPPLPVQVVRSPHPSLPLFPSSISPSISCSGGWSPHPSLSLSLHRSLPPSPCSWRLQKTIWALLRYGLFLPLYLACPVHSPREVSVCVCVTVCVCVSVCVTVCVCVWERVWRPVSPTVLSL